MIQRYSHKTTLESRGQRLDQVLADWLPRALARPVSKAKARKLIVAGAVYLNGRRVRIASKELMPNAQIDAYVDARKLFEDEARSDQVFEMNSARILFEDESIIVVDKPPGLPTQPTLDEARDNLFAAVKKFLSKREGVVEHYLALHHRLDRDTSGVILFAKAREANAGVARMFAEHQARKHYNALALGQPAQSEWTERNYLGKLPGAGKQSRYGAVRSGGDVAETGFTVLGRGRESFWVEARPLTGRTHQIRVHLSEAGYPIIGDRLYGPRVSGQSPRMMLHAVRLTFPHPIHQTELSVEAPLPQDFLQCARQFIQKNLD